MMRLLLCLALIPTGAALAAGDAVSVFQWRGEGDLEAALAHCSETARTPAGVLVVHTRGAALVKVLDEQVSSQLDERCMREHGLTLDRTISHASQNPQYVALYEKLTGVRIQSPGELEQEEAARVAKAQAQRRQDEEQLARCASREATVGDSEQCRQIEAGRVAPH